MTFKEATKNINSLDFPPEVIAIMLEILNDFKDDFEEDYQCIVCGGSGEGSADGTTCQLCKGKGELS